MALKPRILVHRDPDLCPPLSPDFAAALGNLVAEWSNVEEYLAGIIKEVLALRDMAASAVTAELTTNQRLSLLTTLVRESRIQDAYDDWQEIIAAIEPVQTERNRLVHSRWFGHLDGTQTQIHERARGQVRRILAARPTRDILAKTEEVRIIFDKLATFLNHVPALAFALSHDWPPGQPLSSDQGRKARNLDQQRQTARARLSADRDRSAASAARKSTAGKI